MKNPFLRNSLLFFAAFVFMFPCRGFAALRLNAPSQAGIGNPFVAEAWSDIPTENITFSWRGKNCPVKTLPTASGSHAVIMLPVPLDEKASSRKLEAFADKKSKAAMTIKIVQVNRSVQKLRVDKKYVNPPAEAQDRIKADREKVRNTLATSQPVKKWALPFVRPVQGSVSSQFGLKRVFNGQPRGEHRGLDLRGAQGTPIHAAADGTVALADNLYYSGNTVYLDHGDGVFSAYLHMSAIDVKPGQEVKAGQVIGRVGATGRVTGPHLHLSLLVQGASVDPLPLLETQTRPTKGGKNGR